MSGVFDLKELLRSMSPEIQEGVFVFCTFADNQFDYRYLDPIALFCETEGLTLIISSETAAKENIPFEGTFKQITLTVHSSLAAVGLTAAVAHKLAAYGISANIVAAFYHDHIFVQTERAEEALSILKEFSENQDVL